MPHRDIIVIGASAGGVEALVSLVRGLGADLAASLFVTIHFPRDATSVLPRILSRAGALEAVHAGDGDEIRPGRIYVAPPDHHLMLHDGRTRLVRGPTENGHRPAVDPMFRSAAVAYGRRVIGVVLTGNLDDGTAGLLAIKRRGGSAVAQDPTDALFPSMPTSAIGQGIVDHVAPLDQIPALLQRLVGESFESVNPPEERMPDDARRENAYSSFDLGAIEQPERHPGEPGSFSCPDCGGVLWEIRDGEMVRYRCRVGHGWTSDGLVAQQSETLDAALWTALRALEESASLNRLMAKRAHDRGNTLAADRFDESAYLAQQRAGLVREVLLNGRDVEAEIHAAPAPAPLAVVPTTGEPR